MKKRFVGLMTAILMLCGACSSSESPGGDGGGGSVATPPEARGARYCEILLGYLQSPDVRIDVYNTYGLDDCPAEAWNSLDPAQIQEDHHADRVILNGPRRWILDRFVNSAFLDPTEVVIGGIAMRKAGEIVVPIADAMSSPYATRAVERTTTWVFDAGKKVYELVDPAGRIFVMQSFSLEKGDRSETDLQGLSGQLHLPSMWTYRTRLITNELQVTAVDGVATVVQDDQGNTYQLSQQ